MTRQPRVLCHIAASSHALFQRVAVTSSLKEEKEVGEESREDISSQLSDLDCVYRSYTVIT
jgi:hypothetical protein